MRHSKKKNAKASAQNTTGSTASKQATEASTPQVTPSIDNHGGLDVNPPSVPATPLQSQQQSNTGSIGEPSEGLGLKREGSTSSGTFYRFARWFDGVGDTPAGQEGPTLAGGLLNANLGQPEASGAADTASNSETPLATSTPPQRPTLTLQTDGIATQTGYSDAQVAPNTTQAETATVDPDPITPAPPLDFGPLDNNLASPPIAGTNFYTTGGSLAIPISIGDQPAPGAHQHRMGYDKCNHESNNFVECEETDPVMCRYNANLKLRGQCSNCTSTKGVRNSVRRFNQWISRTAGRITYRNRGSIGNDTFNQGRDDGVSTGGEAGGGGGDGQGGGRPLSGHALRTAERERRRSARGPTGSSVGAGGFDPNIQEDTGSDKS
ncbi:hypothetical protein ABW20_dc0102638 [Dactylellina cionopaga]|nr:hypothetical protein ABW20_dc0102638 [Dactylellina cionopaga]